MKNEKTKKKNQTGKIIVFRQTELKHEKPDRQAGDMRWDRSVELTLTLLQTYLQLKHTSYIFTRLYILYKNLYD